LCDGALKDLPPAVSVPPLALPPAGSQLPHGENSSWRDHGWLFLGAGGLRGRL